MSSQPRKSRVSQSTPRPRSSHSKRRLSQSKAPPQLQSEPLTTWAALSKLEALNEYWLQEENWISIESFASADTSTSGKPIRPSSSETATYRPADFAPSSMYESDHSDSPPRKKRRTYHCPLAPCASSPQEAQAEFEGEDELQRHLAARHDESMRGELEVYRMVLGVIQEENRRRLLEWGRARVGLG